METAKQPLNSAKIQRQTLSPPFYSTPYINTDAYFSFPTLG